MWWQLQRQYTESDKRTCLQQCDSMKQEREKQVEEETREKEEEHQEQHEEEEDQNPYVFEEDKDFSTRVETEGGSIRVLKKFTEKSKLLQGIENFRLAILEARAHTFVSPRHFDSEVVLFNIKGAYI